MTGTATQTDIYVGYYGDGTTHWKVDPPLDGSEYILICDRTALASVTQVLGEPESGVVFATRIVNPVEVFPCDENGAVTGKSMDTIAEPVSLLRPADGIDLKRVLAQLGYVEATS